MADSSNNGLEMLVDAESLPGSFDEAGVLVFDDLDYQPTVSANTKLAVFSGSEGQVEPTAGVNVLTDYEDEGTVYYAEVDGVCRLINNQITVFEVLNIEDAVGFETGNLQFDGSIYIKGKVGQAFQVKSGGDVIVSGSIEASAKVSAMGNISVGGAINGIRTKVIGMESIRASRVHDAYIFSEKNIELGASSENGTLRSGGSITVQNTEEVRGGLISGGQAWALHGMDAHTAGTPTGTATQLNAGLDLEHGKKLDDLTGKIESGNQQIQRLLDRFNMTSLDVAQIQKRLAEAQSPKNKILANSAHQLGQIVKAHQERAKLNDSLGKTVTNARVTVREKAYAGVAIRIGDQATKVRNDIEHSVFLVRNDTLVYAPIDEGEPN